MQAQIKRYWPLFLVLNTLLFNEYLIFHFSILLNCSWPCDEQGSCQHNSLRVMILADTHLLGQYQGHWFDKLKREWQMYRSYQTALHLGPEAIFFLGDLMDEGQWTDERLFNEYADRFDELFSTGPDGPPVHVLAGNHDLGFHYELHPHRIGWFRSRFNTSIVDTVHIKGQPFVLVNSMAMHGDGCDLCKPAEEAIDRISSLMTCARNSSCSDKAAKTFKPNKRPILLQHFPLWRTSDKECVRDSDWDDSVSRTEEYRPKWEAISPLATRNLLNKLQPRAVFNGHSHRACKKKWTRPVEFWEHTVNSFSWRNGDRPSFLMVSIDDKQVRVRTCHLPRESVCIYIYVTTGVILVLWLFWRFFILFRHFSRPQRRDDLLLDDKGAKTE